MAVPSVPSASSTWPARPSPPRRTPPWCSALSGVFLLLGSFFGRAGGLILVGLLAAAATVGATVADQWDPHSTRRASRRQPPPCRSSYTMDVGEIVLDLTEVTRPAGARRPRDHRHRQRRPPRHPGAGRRDRRGRHPRHRARRHQRLRPRRRRHRHRPDGRPLGGSRRAPPDHRRRPACRRHRRPHRAQLPRSLP